MIDSNIVDIAADLDCKIIMILYNDIIIATLLQDNDQTKHTQSRCVNTITLFKSDTLSDMWHHLLLLSPAMYMVIAACSFKCRLFLYQAKNRLIALFQDW